MPTTASANTRRQERRKTRTALEEKKAKRTPRNGSRGTYTPFFASYSPLHMQYSPCRELPGRLRPHLGPCILCWQASPLAALAKDLGSPISHLFLFTRNTRNTRNTREPFPGKTLTQNGRADASQAATRTGVLYISRAYLTRAVCTRRSSIDNYTPLSPPPRHTAMLFKSVLCAAAAAGSAWATPIASETEASCSGNKAIDNFSGWANKTNSLGSIVGGTLSPPVLPPVLPHASPLTSQTTKPWRRCPCPARRCL